MNSGKKKAATITKLLELSEQLINKSKWYKNVASKHEELSAKLKMIKQEILVIRNTLQLKEKDLTALDTAAKALSKKLKAITKEIQKIQKQFSKKHTDIRSKLLVPLESVEGGSRALLDATKENCKRIEEIIKISRGFMEEDCKSLDECSRELKDLSLKLTKLLLSKTVEDCTVTSLDLKERLEAVVKSTMDMTAEDSPQQFDPVSVKKTLTILHEHCASSVKLLDLVSLNVKRVFPDGAVKAEKKEGAEETKKEGINGHSASNGVAKPAGTTQHTNGSHAADAAQPAVAAQLAVGAQSNAGTQPAVGAQPAAMTPSFAAAQVAATQAAAAQAAAAQAATSQTVVPGVQGAHSPAPNPGTSSGIATKTKP